ADGPLAVVAVVPWREGGAGFGAGSGGETGGGPVRGVPGVLAACPVPPPGPGGDGLALGGLVPDGFGVGGDGPDGPGPGGFGTGDSGLAGPGPGGGRAAPAPALAA
ncbi:hypothetical protein RKE29_30680, partial [Streptomyces sp. B1866]|nr:hypothetical protein [Streptomyces sp. B1866]